ncbi:MAG: ABC transporter ATP-binding protein/permease [Clostridiales bacterium]|jgi:ATP-binding cassette subfamily B protein|nr:ABC transporter ATP-binding protein/permease [Clostridiales bacterium]
MLEVKWVWENLKGYRKRYVLCFLLSVTIQLFVLINPNLARRLVDEALLGGNTQLLVPLVLTMCGVTFGRTVIGYGMMALVEFSSQGLVFNLRKRMYENFQRQDMSFYGSNPVGDLMTAMTSDMDMIRHNVAFVFRQIISGLVLFLGTTICFFVINWKFALCIIALTPLIFCVTFVYNKRVRHIYIELRRRLSLLNTDAQENIEGNRVVKAFANERYEIEKFQERNGAYREQNLFAQRTWLKYFPYIEGLAQSMAVTTLLFGGIFLIRGELTGGEYMMFSSLSWAVTDPLRQLGQLFNDLQHFFASAMKMMTILGSHPRVVTPEHPKAPAGADGAAAASAVGADATEAAAGAAAGAKSDAAGIAEAAAGAAAGAESGTAAAAKARAAATRIRGDIAFHNVGFHFGQGPVLADISFHIRPGETYALMGETGSGKTVIADLISRFYDVTSGSVTIDGVDVRDWDLHALRSGIGMTTQETFLFSDTVDGNIAYGSPDLPEEDVKQFARISAAQFIDGMSDGYDTIIGERGVGLSGGQKQRIALARALAIRPSILILDDTTSAVDMETEKYIQEQLTQLDFPCTKLIIAQRISSVKKADCILLLKDGKVAERGSHEALLAARGQYYELWKIQTGAGELPEFMDPPPGAPTDAGPTGQTGQTGETGAATAADTRKGVR